MRVIISQGIEITGIIGSSLGQELPKISGVVSAVGEQHQITRLEDFFEEKGVKKVDIQALCAAFIVLGGPDRPGNRRIGHRDMHRNL